MVKVSLIYLNIIDNQISKVSQHPSGLLDCRSECRRLDNIPIHREVWSSVRHRCVRGASHWHSLS